MTSDRSIKKRSNPVDIDTDEEFEAGEMHVSKSVKIHGVMTSLSPMKPIHRERPNISMGN